jgi:HemY protein
MRSLLWLLAVLAAAVALVLLARVEAGYVLFFYPPWRVEMSMVFFVVAALVSFLVLVLLFRLLAGALGLPATVRAWRARGRRERAYAALAAALQAYYEGRYARAEKEAQIAFESGPTPGVAALLAARAAHQMRDFDRRDRWLERADDSGDGLQAARLVSRAELALEDRDFVAARDALRNLHGAGPKHVATTRLLLRAERGAGAWDEVLRLASQLSQRDAISPALAGASKVQATVVACSGARHATALGMASLAREILENALAAEWVPQLVALYGELPGSLPAEEKTAEARARIERAERWLLERNRDSQLLAALGRLCAQAELWGKARSFLEASLSFEESRTARVELARLAERLGQPDEAQRHFRRAAELS